MVHGVWLRLHAQDIAALDDPEALVTGTTRLALDRLRPAKAERGQYIGPWLPEASGCHEIRPLCVLALKWPIPAAFTSQEFSLNRFSGLTSILPCSR